MAKTRDYMDYLDDEIGIAPANSQEEFQAAETIVEVMKDHGLEPSIQEFDTHPLGRLMPQVVSLVLFLALLVCGVANGAPKVIAFLLALVCAVLLAMRHFGRNVFENLGPARRSQNVVAVHHATGDKVVKGARPIVILAHYDTPRQNVLYSSSLARYQSFLKRAAFPSTCVATIGSLFQVLGFVPSAVRLFVWVIALVASLPIVVVAVAAIIENFGAYTTGSNDNKSSVAALMAVLAKVRPGEDRVDATIEGKPYVRRASEPAPKPQPVYEEVRGVRHGREVLESLGMLPADCEIVYEAPRQINVSGDAGDEVAAAEASAPEQYQTEAADLGHEQGFVQQPQAEENTYASYDEEAYAEGEQPYDEAPYDHEAPYDQTAEQEGAVSYADQGYDAGDSAATDSDGYGPVDEQEVQDVADQWPDDAMASDAQGAQVAEKDAYGELYAEETEPAPSAGTPGKASDAVRGTGKRLLSRIKGLFHRGDGDPIAIRRGKDLTDGESVDYSEFEAKYEGDELDDLDELDRPAGASFAGEKRVAPDEALLPLTPDDMPQNAVEEDAPLEEADLAPVEGVAVEPAQTDDEATAVAPVAPAEVEDAAEKDVEVVSVAPKAPAAIPDPIRVDDSDVRDERTSLSAPEGRDEQAITTQSPSEAEQATARRATRRQPRPESVRVVQDEAHEVEAEVLVEEDYADAEPGSSEEKEPEGVIAAADLDWDQPAVEDPERPAEEPEDVVDLSKEGAEVLPGDTAAFKMPAEADVEYGSADASLSEDSYAGDAYAEDVPYDEGAPFDDEAYDMEENGEGLDCSDAQYEQVGTDDGAEKTSFSDRVRGAFSRLRQRLARSGGPAEGADSAATGDAAPDREAVASCDDGYAPGDGYYADEPEEAGYDDYDSDYADADYADESLEDGYADLPEEAGEPVDSPDANPRDPEGRAAAAKAGGECPEREAGASRDEDARHDGDVIREELDGRVSYLELGEEGEGDDILPKDTSGLDTLTDLDLDEDEETVPSRPAPRPIDDPNWGKSTYEPPSTTPNIARRAALFDLPDVSSRTSDPLSGSKDYEDEGDLGDSADAVAEGPAADLGDTAEYDATTDDPTSPLHGWKGGAALRSDLREQDVMAPDDNAGAAASVDDSAAPDAAPAQSAVDDQAVGAEDAPAEDAPSAVDEGDLQDAILGLGDDYLIAHDIWFVCVGGSEMDHAGARSFVANFRRDLRGAFLVNLDSIGAGQLVTLTNEGYDEGRRADRRSSRLLTQTASDLQIPVEKIDYGWEETDATCAMRARVRAITVMGMDENGLPALSHTENDVPMNVDPKQVSSVARLICEFIRRS
ncbi:M28 family peptidase [Atopobiaceae bacterium HCP3S3_D6]